MTSVKIKVKQYCCKINDWETKAILSAGEYEYMNGLMFIMDDTITKHNIRNTDNVALSWHIVVTALAILENNCMCSLQI